MQSAHPESPAMVSVARFPDRDQAEAFRAVAAECGVLTRVADVRRFSRIFDATLGGADSIQGVAVEVKAEDVAVLKNFLESTLEIDPLDPMHTASRDELRALAESPLDGNLCEKIIAAEILAKLPPAENSPPPAGAVEGPDAYLSIDRRTARWLGVTGIIFTLVYLAILAEKVLALSHPHSAWHYTAQREAGFERFIELPSGDIADNVRPFLLILVPMATGAALIMSWRPLRDGTRRRMFPAIWRITGMALFWFPITLMGSAVGLAFLARAVRGGG